MYCDAGKYTDMTGSIACKSCGPGLYQDEKGRWTPSCKKCLSSNENPNKEEEATGCVVSQRDIEKEERATVVDVKVFSTWRNGTSLRIEWTAKKKSDGSINSIDGIHDETTHFNVSISVTKRFDGWKDGSNQGTVTHQVDKSRQFLVLDVMDPSFPTSDNGMGPPMSLFDLTRYVRVNQFNQDFQKGGTWSPLSEDWVDANDCLDQWIDASSSNPIDWRCCPCPTGAACNRVRKDNVVARQGYWRVPTHYFDNTKLQSEADDSVPSDMSGRICTTPPKFVLCPYQERCEGVSTGNLTMDKTTEHCKYGTEGPMCALCQENFAREGSSCAPCSSDALGKKAAIFAGGILIFIMLSLVARYLFRQMPRRFKKMRKDLFRIFIIAINFSQISTSLPSVFNVEWPSEYLRFLDTLNVFNINVLELTGVSCATKIDHAAKLLAMACFPLVLVLYSMIKLCHGRARSTFRISSSDTSKHLKLWTHAVEQAFDVIDREGDELLEALEVIDFFDHLGVKLTEKQSLQKIRSWSQDPTAMALTREQFVTVLIADAQKHQLVTKHQQDKAIAWMDDFVTVSKALSSVGELMFAIHAPVSQAAFEWFWFVQLGDKAVLRVDPAIYQESEKWESMFPVAMFVLLVLTAGLPLFLGFYLFTHRYELDSIGVLSRFGWSYDRYSPGVEWWGIHEIVRKLILTGLLIYVPSVSMRVCVALVVSILAVMNLNYWEPFKNKIVFWVSEIAFIMTAVKYVVAMLRLSTPEENINVEQRSKAVGVFLIAADAMTFVLFFMSGVLCIVWLFRSWKAAEVEETKKNKSDSGVHRRCRLRKKSTMVVPVPLPMVVMPKELALSAATEIRTWSLDQAKDKEKENNST
jgi:hypothetical protein